MGAAKPQDIRNIALLGHGGAGKTTLAEALLHAAGVTGRQGAVDDGSSHLDYTDIEKERKHSVDPALAHLDHDGKTVNLIDAPGYPDFIGGAVCALGGVDTAVIVVSALAGIEVNTRRLFALARQIDLPVAFVVAHIDGENVDLPTLTAQLSEAFGPAVRPMNLPAGGGTSVIDCFSQDSGEADFGDVPAAHQELVENIVEADEELMEAYLADETVPAEKLGAAFAEAMVAGTIFPLLFVCAPREVGVPELLDAVARYFPSPADLAPRPVRKDRLADAETVELAADPAKPFVGQAFKITSDPFVGKLAWIRVLQGTVASDTTYLVGDQKKSAKIGHPLKVQGKETTELDRAVAGDIFALAKVEELVAGDVLHTESQPMFRDLPPAPVPMFSLAVEPKSRGDEQKISTALQKLSEEDPTFTAQRDGQTGETVISGIADLHLRVMLTKMKERFDLEVQTKPPKIPYRETILAAADGHHRHKKQTGGAGQFGEVFLRVEPLERGAGFEFASELFGESIPRQFLPAIEKGVRDVMQAGAIAGYPLQDIKVAITDGKHHPVDSKEVAFRTASKNAFLDAIQKAKPALLEPIVSMDITVPAEHMGDIVSDLTGRRGRIQGQDVLPGNMALIQAQAPLAEVMMYDSQLRSVTGGRGSYTMDFSHYEPVPGNVQQQIIAQTRKEKEEQK